MEVCFGADLSSFLQSKHCGRSCPLPPTDSTRRLAGSGPCLADTLQQGKGADPVQAADTLSVSLSTERKAEVKPSARNSAHHRSTKYR